MAPKGRNYLSNPVFEVTGEAYGYVGIKLPFNWGYNWSKCWLNTKQTVFSFSDPPPRTDGIIQAIIGLPVAATSDSRQLIFIEDGYPETVNLPGLMALPAAFFLPETVGSLFFELEWQFDMQLEGDALLYLGHTSDAQVCTIRHPQWAIRGA